jgi:ABC-type branched-subunit amino acid transport system ATPase component
MTAPVLEVSKLTVRFGGLVALNELDFAMRPGEFVGLIGPNGSGKTTFFNALTGIYAPASGSVALSGRDITGLQPQRIYDSGITRTFQRPARFAPVRTGVTVADDRPASCRGMPGAHQ